MSVRGEKRREFLASSDPWFHPVYLTTGPDGALYVVDFYRRWVEHPKFVPENLRSGVDWREGAGHGRIWRIRRRHAAPVEAPRLAHATAAELVDHLSHPNGWIRDTAQRQLVERQQKSAVPLLRKLVTDGASMKGRQHALWTLDGLDALDEESLVAALVDHSAVLREQALRLVPPRWAEDAVVRGAVLALADDPDPAIRFRLALVLGAGGSREHLAALVKLAESIDEEPWTAMALSGGLGSAAAPLLAELAKADPSWFERPTRGQLNFLVQLGQSIGGQAGEPEVLAPTLELALCRSPNCISPGALAVVAGLSRGLTDVGRSFSAALEETAIDGQPALLELARALPAARQLALDTEHAVEYRLVAIEVLGVADTAEHGRNLKGLLDSGVPQEVQSAAALALARLADDELAADLLGGWSGYTRPTRRAMIDSALRTSVATAALVDSLEQGDIAPVELEASQREALMKIRDKALAERVQRVLAPASHANREEVIVRYQASLHLAGDRRRGAALFERHCKACHAVQGFGHRVGPDLSGATAKSKESLLIDVLDPSRQVLSDYVAYTLATEDGQVFSGLLMAETASSITLRRAEGLEVTVLRSQIEELRASNTSLLPEGLEQQISEQDLADLLQFLVSPNQEGRR